MLYLLGIYKCLKLVHLYKFLKTKDVCERKSSSCYDTFLDIEVSYCLKVDIVLTDLCVLLLSELVKLQHSRKANILTQV